MKKLLWLMFVALPAFAQVEFDSGTCSTTANGGESVEWSCADVTPIPEPPPPEPEPEPEPEPIVCFDGCTDNADGSYRCGWGNRQEGSCLDGYTEARSGWFNWLYTPDVVPEPEPDPTPEPDPIPEPEPEPEPEPDPIPEPDPDPPPSQSAYRGIPDPSAALGFDVFADYPADEVLTGSQGNKTISCVGSAADPCVIDASQATFTKVTLSGSYIILQGGTLNAPSAQGYFVTVCSTCVVRDFEAIGPGTDQSHSTVIGMNSNSVWIRGSVHDFGNKSRSAREQDFHGFKPCGDSNVWIWEVEAYNLSGDGVQAGDSSRCSASDVYIAGGNFHDNRENGVDIKDSRNIVVSGATMSGFRATPNNDPGAAIVIHDDAFNAKIYDNVITDANIGVVTSGESGHQITNNTINALSTGIECRNTSNLTITGNTIIAPTPIDRQSNCNGTIQ